MENSLNIYVTRPDCEMFNIVKLYGNWLSLAYELKQRHGRLGASGFFTLYSSSSHQQNVQIGCQKCAEATSTSPRIQIITAFSVLLGLYGLLLSAKRPERVPHTRCCKAGVFYCCAIYLACVFVVSEIRLWKDEGTCQQK